MSDNTSLLDLIAVGQASKEATANAIFNAASPATLGAQRANTTGGLTWGYYGGLVIFGGARVAIANGTVALTGSATNYVELNPVTGAITKNTTAFTPGLMPLYKVVTDPTDITSYQDYRGGGQNPMGGRRKTLTESTATGFAEVACGIGERVAGELLINIEADDGNDFQVRTMRALFAASNMGGTPVFTLSTPEEIAAITAGTLACTLDIVAAAGKITLRANAVSSLTQTTLRAQWRILSAQALAVTPL